MMADRVTMSHGREVEQLLPWHATGRLSPADTCRVDRELAVDPALARDQVGIRDQRAGIVGLNDALGSPSPRALQALFAAIDLDIARRKNSG